MYIDDCSYDRDGKTYRRVLLRESFRKNGKVAKRTVTNLSQWPEHLVEAVSQALDAGRKGKVDTGSLTSALAAGDAKLTVEQGKSVGAVATVLSAAKALGIDKALGDDRSGRLALFQVMARVIEQGSRLSAVRQAKNHVGCQMLGLDEFDENTLYENLTWLSEEQELIEDRLFAQRQAPEKGDELFLYDVTSSYFEGTENELAAFGYNRDKKKGKKQVVVGLLADSKGVPLSVELFPGNTQDPATVASQISKLQERFGGGELTLVGDRGMLKSPQQEALQKAGMHYLTAITEAQIRKLANDGVIQLELFDEEVAEVIDEANAVRYLLHLNPTQAAREAHRRADKLATYQAYIEGRNTYLEEHPQATVETALRNVNKKAKTLRIDNWAGVAAEGRTLAAVIDEEARDEAALLDGCYALKTDLPPEVGSAEDLDQRYHDLSNVEWAFRTSKTAHLELRPIYLQRADRTRGHAFVVMLAYFIIRYLATCWKDQEVTVEEGLRELSQLCSCSITMADGSVLHEIPVPRPTTAALLDAAKVELPRPISLESGAVDTTAKLTSRRK